MTLSDRIIAALKARGYPLTLEAQREIDELCAASQGAPESVPDHEIADRIAKIRGTH